MHKREFLRTLGGGALGLLITPELAARMARVTPQALARDEPFWDAIRASYRLPTEYINLESGYYSMQAQPVLEAFIGHVRMLNLEAAHYMRTVMGPNKSRVQARLAAMAGCGADELIITRNTTESLDTVISGFDWKPGDEAVYASHDYGAMIDQFKLQAKRYGMVNKVVNVPLHPRSDEEVVQVYADAITPRTRLLMVCHVVNLTGQVLPVRKVAEMAHARGVAVMVDGAHAFAQLDFRIPDTGADFYGASLHKWLGVPLGAGILYVRKDRIAKLWPLYGDEGFADDDIRKLNHTGTVPCHTDLGIEDAIAFHERIGTARKQERLRWLQQYWTSRARAVPRVVLNTPSDPARSCAIANVAIEGVAPAALAKRLMEEHRIFTVAIDRREAGIAGVRVTPHLFTSTAELDALVAALREIAG
ncbi:MAG: aminotransferase class V-fold PLP-dependent enzyme [Gemmatimonadetes bacterium]|nr:aminotransferase class V-fold PLP-dependent enzyme [Gemmatimonadota bacterium]